MKKIYFALFFSIFFFLLSPGMKAEAGHNSFPEFSMVFQNATSSNGTTSAVTFTTTSSDFYAFSVETCDGTKGVFILSKEPATATYSYKWNENREVSLKKSVNEYSSSDYYGALLVDFSPQSLGSNYSDSFCNFSLKESYGSGTGAIYVFAKEVAQKLAGGEDPFYVPPTYTPDYTGIGYLTGMEDFYKELEIRNETGGLTTGNVTDKTFHFGWNRKTSTGLDIFTNDFDDSYVEVAISSVISRPLKDGTTYYSSTNGKIHQLDKLRDTYIFEYKYSDVLSLFADGLNEARNAQGFFDDLLTSGYSQPSLKLYYYFRVVVQDSSGNYTYGPWLRMNPDKTFDKYNANSSPGSSIVVGITDENDNFIISSDSEYGEGDHLTGGYGSGWNWEDAAIDSNKNKVVVNSYASNIEDLINMIQAMPNIVRTLFTFLPPWVLALFSLLVASIVPIIVIKIVT